MTRKDLYLKLLILVCVSRLDGLKPKLLSVTRSKEHGDLFEVSLKNSSTCETSTCGIYGGFLHRKVKQKTTADKCSCYCNKAAKPTFYRNNSGQQACVKDADVVRDGNRGTCDFYTTTNTKKIDVFDFYTKGRTIIGSHHRCEQIHISGWKFHLNFSWIASTSSTFRVNHGGNIRKKTQMILLWDGSLHSFYDGLLVKVLIGCTHRGKTLSLCVMLKAKGTHNYREVPLPVPRDHNQVSMTALSRKENNSVQYKTMAEESDLTPTERALQSSDWQITKGRPSEESNQFFQGPTTSYSKQSSRQTWLVVFLSLAGSVFIAVVVISVCLFGKCRKNCRKQQRTVSRRQLVSARESSQPPSNACAVSALQDYEYVHYPCLVEESETQPVKPTGNIKYERGEDNKLIIWSKGHDGVTTPNKQATSTTAPRLPYQRLLSRTSSSTPDCSSSMKPSSPLAAEEVSSYQKLVKSSCRPVSEGCRYGREVIHGATDNDHQRAYQCLSLQRNPTKSPAESESGYTRMDELARTESTAEYDYADPVGLNKFSRLKRSQSEPTTLEISIGDLIETTQNQQEEEEQQGDYECIDLSINNSLTNGGYENVDIDNKSSYATRKQPQIENDEASNDSQTCLTGEYTDPEEYMEMAKRTSLITMDNQIQYELSPCQSFDKIDEEPEYYVLECAETDGEKEGDDP
ncbi:uncharacterized protein LOC141863913 [Acropora palmata]|uniref:uncharacterized protein LOC141863913 n=1 Tax=Acropora palmata TaxID=6131 RepID=UPI003DA13380